MVSSHLQAFVPAMVIFAASHFSPVVIGTFAGFAGYLDSLTGGSCICTVHGSFFFLNKALAAGFVCLLCRRSVYLDVSF